MSKFKIGDVVRVLPFNGERNEIIREDDMANCWVDEMDRYVNKVYTVVNIHKGGYDLAPIDDDPDFWEFSYLGSWLEKVDDTLNEDDEDLYLISLEGGSEE